MIGKANNGDDGKSDDNTFPYMSGTGSFFHGSGSKQLFPAGYQKGMENPSPKGLSFQRSEKQQEKKSCKEQEIILDITYIDTKIRL